MGRPPTRQLTLRFVLRTLERLRMVTRLDDKNLAEELKAAGWRLNDVAFLGQYLLNVVELNGGLNHDHPNGNCPQCGHDIGRDHNGARYCSNRCRQRAYRLRLNRQGQ